MAKIDAEIEKLIFYTFGRTERDIEVIALRYGISKGDFADRLSALLSTTPNGTVLGVPNRMPTLPEETGPHNPGVEPLALGEFSPGDRVHHAGQERVSHGEKATAYRKMILKAMRKLTPPSSVGQFVKATGIPSGSIYRVMNTMKNEGVVEYDKGEVSWGGTQSRQHTAKTAPRRKNTLPPGEATRLVMKFVRNKQLTQAQLCQLLRKKHQQINKYVWNVTISTLVKQGKLHRWDNGLVTREQPSTGGKHVNKPVAANA
jgi:hypothetical protein